MGIDIQIVYLLDRELISQCKQLKLRLCTTTDDTDPSAVTTRQIARSQSGIDTATTNITETLEGVVQGTESA
ncbi:MAG: hypothetical protein JAY64_12225, partial [Candidatus Thiodiazotropha weberae]|nr:hypothetical protein [Candidatus Thiodiazotropha lotti]MCW4211920.1 hypothetical protein [Candidatus Thiodiazotropha lotti]